MTIMKKRSNFNRSLCAIAVSFVLGTVSHMAVGADSASSGYVSGTAKTATGESVAGATIVIKNQDTGLERRITTGANGSYRFPLLPTGNYLVTAEKDGYQMARLENVKVSMARRVRVVVRSFFHNS
ncbi:MAG: carboxypeptidase regulatory-like domain-containing protein [Gammaproteobacteria bacterium]|nr:carboxypeptidase regulatory-like domain-containing protein [Gammaproteobacteria bacterium]